MWPCPQCGLYAAIQFSEGRCECLSCSYRFSISNMSAGLEELQRARAEEVRIRKAITSRRELDQRIDELTAIPAVWSVKYYTVGVDFAFDPVAKAQEVQVVSKVVTLGDQTKEADPVSKRFAGIEVD